MKLDEIASHKVFILSPAEPIARALMLMQEEDIQHLPVVRGRAPLGMVSDHDVLEYGGWHQISGRHTSASSTRVEKIMKSPIVSLSRDDPIEAAAAMMLKKHIGAVPLVDNERLVGIVTESDFLRFLAEPNSLISEEHRGITCEQCMSKDVLCVGPNDETLETYRLMRSRQVRHLPVLENNRLIGIISDRDVLRGAPSQAETKVAFGSHSPVASPLHVRGIMSRDIATRPPSTPVSEAAELMLDRRIRSIPIVEPEQDQLVGILTETDLLRFFVECYQP